jgi:hypothetical protein
MHLDILTTAVQAAVGVVSSQPALLVDRLRVMPDQIRRLVLVGVHQGASNALAAADTQLDEPWSPTCCRDGLRATTRISTVCVRWSSPGSPTPLLLSSCRRDSL